MPRGARTADPPADRRCQDRQHYIALGGRRALAGLGILTELHGLQILGDLLRGLQILWDLLHGLQTLGDLLHGLQILGDLLHGLQI